jgi:hypothetical protein
LATNRGQWRPRRLHRAPGHSVLLRHSPHLPRPTRSSLRTSASSERERLLGERPGRLNEVDWHRKESRRVPFRGHLASSAETGAGRQSGRWPELGRPARNARASGRADQDAHRDVGDVARFSADPYHFGDQHRRSRTSFARSPARRVGRRLAARKRSASAFPALVLIRVTLRRCNATAVLTRLGSRRPAPVRPLGAVARVSAVITAPRPGHVAGCVSGSLPHGLLHFLARCPQRDVLISWDPPRPQASPHRPR